ncbi:hypothetical protein DACRYDRAFT_101098 [Dacryopinax primogenitus]|uniref:DNA replication regulator SLD2 n=1 Tax=Dacryopinax primogenitus (strain DJM 731) TaxID=1858805 RepID=M5FRX1_DACPD|nr:uncharacterized protein DACRYDRAFT_101098 [Dacryopinax primogenitus]EJU00001.1 hypothetical protein DACRYDRAFT_101098 [Dacryopinax primogenitus]
MDGNAIAIDLAQLRSDLKAWEREFKARKGREPTRDDIKKVPAIDTKYKTYNKARSRPGTSSSAASQVGVKQNKKPIERPSNRPSPTASSSTTVESIGNAEESFNPFRSPRKGGPSIGRSPVKPKLGILFTDQNPFAADDKQTTPTTALFAKLTGSSPANNLSGGTLKKSLFMSATPPELPPSPSKSILKPSSAPIVLTDVEPNVALTPSKYVSAASPAKLRALIQASKTADTPRTKARKRLAGEEDFTPVKSDKRRRLNNLVNVKVPSSEVEEMERSVTEEEMMDVDEFGPTPKKTDAPKRFKSIFESPMKQESKGKGLFSKRTVSFTGPSSSRENSKQPSEPPQPSTSLKRPTSPEPGSSKPMSAGLIPPSPPATTTASKIKARKKPKKGKKTQKDEIEENMSSSDSEIQIREIPYSRWGGMQARRRPRGGPEDEEDEIWDFDVFRPAPALSQDSAIAEEADEELTVRLPTDMFDLLDLDSPVKNREQEERVIQRIFDPRRKGSVEQEVFGAGEWEEEEDEGDWQEEPDGWKGESQLDMDDF